MFIVSIYFFVLTQKSNKKSQGKHERSARFAVPARPSLFVLLQLMIICVFFARHHLVIDVRSLYLLSLS